MAWRNSCPTRKSSKKLPLLVLRPLECPHESVEGPSQAPQFVGASFVELMRKIGGLGHGFDFAGDVIEGADGRAGDEISESDGNEYADESNQREVELEVPKLAIDASQRHGELEGALFDLSGL